MCTDLQNPCPNNPKGLGLRLDKIRTILHPPQLAANKIMKQKKEENCEHSFGSLHLLLTHYPATHQNYKATRPCKAGFPPDLGLKQAKGFKKKLSEHTFMNKSGTHNA
jgi:hypothetical protein